MNTSRAVQVAITQSALALGIGAVMEALLPPITEGAALSHQAFEAVVQIGLNGVAIAGASRFLSQNDPTNGILFAALLMQAQPGLKQRTSLLSDAVRRQVRVGTQQMVVHTQAA